MQMPQRTFPIVFQCCVAWPWCYCSFHPYFIAEFGRERYIVKPSKVINIPQLHLCWKGNLGMWMPLSQLNDPFLVCLLVCYIRASSQDLSVTLGLHGQDIHSILNTGAVHCTLKCGPGVCSPCAGHVLAQRAACWWSAGWCALVQSHPGSHPPTLLHTAAQHEDQVCHLHQ